MNNPLYDHEFEESLAQNVARSIVNYQKAKADFFLALYEFHETGYTTDSKELEDIEDQYKEAVARLGNLK